jgi:ABC-type multidrug transport system ATPase subunit
MRCLFVIIEAGVCRIEDLPNGSLDVCTDAAGKILFQNAGSVAQPVAHIVCEDFSCRLTPAATHGVRWRGAPLARQTVLNDGDLVEISGAYIWFRRLPAPPVFRNEPCSEIPLKGVERLAFGRSLDGAGAGEDFVLLDPDDRVISHRHVSIVKKDGDYFATDESPTGTFLNGQRFETQRLTVGDRFQVGSYSLEFTGISLRRTQPRIGGRVEARDLAFRVGDRTIIHDITLSIEQCSFSGILGGSGQGKSTLLNALCGINPATSGSVMIEGRSIGLDSQSLGIGFVPQDDIVHPELRVEDAVVFSARLRLDPRVPARPLRLLVEETIRRLGLEEHRDKRISQLSGGQRKRVSIATELLDKPSVLFLDEPSSGLDPATEFSLMRILRGLAAQDCTVICTTHVLGRAYLFDKIIFIHGGRVIFDGPPDLSYGYFQVESLDQVYIRLAEETKSGDEWAEEFETTGPARPPVAHSQPALDLSSFGDIPPAVRKRPGFLHSLVTLLHRQWKILGADRLNLVFLIAQPLLIAMLVGWVAEDLVLRMFLCVVATLWFGCSNGAQQIVKELPIFRRERVCGLGLHSYLVSKYIFLGGITLLQALALLFVVQTTSHIVRPAKMSIADLHAEFRTITTPPAKVVPGSGEEEDFEAVEIGSPKTVAAAPAAAKAPARKKAFVFPRPDLWGSAFAAWFFELRWNLRDAVESGGRSLPGILFVTVSLRVIALAATALVGVAIGLAVSGLVQNTAQAVMWVPLLLIPQILFGGVVLSLPELSAGARAVCQIIPSFSCQRLMDVSIIYGQAVPLLSNRTKIPLFLTPGEKETIRWKLSGKEYSEAYDELSPANTSWQNLVVFPHAVGRHTHEFSEVLTSEGSTKRIYNETTESRDDVRYSKGRVFLNPAPILASTAVAGFWLVLCYAATSAALVARQKGK